MQEILEDFIFKGVFQNTPSFDIKGLRISTFIKMICHGSDEIEVMLSVNDKSNNF